MRISLKYFGKFSSEFKKILTLIKIITIYGKKKASVKTAGMRIWVYTKKVIIFNEDGHNELIFQRYISYININTS